MFYVDHKKKERDTKILAIGKIYAIFDTIFTYK